jgi:hypothetical protein
MVWFLFVMGLIWVIGGTLMLFAIQVVREEYFSRIKIEDPRKWSPLPLAGGILFLLAASSNSQVTFIVILGLLSLLKGLVFLFGPREKVKGMIDWWFKAGIAILFTIVQ